MAYSVSATIAAATTTPVHGQSDLVTVTVTNSGTVSITIDGVEVVPDANSALIVGETSPDWLPQAGSNPTTGYGTKVIAGSGSATFTFPVIAPAAGTYNLNANVIGTRADTGVRIQVCTTSAVQLVAS